MTPPRHGPSKGNAWFSVPTVYGMVWTEEISIDDSETDRIPRDVYPTTCYKARVCCMQQCCFCMCLHLVILFIVYGYGHHLTCALNTNLCIPFSNYVPDLLDHVHDGWPDPWNKQARDIAPSAGNCPLPSLNLPQVLSNHPAMGSASCDLRCKEALAKQSPRLFILLTSQASGSTWINDELKANPFISTFKYEPMWNFSKRCRGWHLGSTDSAGAGCTWEQWQTEAEAKLRKIALAFPDWPAAIGFRLHYDEILANHRQPFSEWVYCNRISVLHFYREAVIKSFWSIQARAFDMAALPKHETEQKNISASLPANRIRLRLDPSTASAYVRNIELNQQQYRQLFLESLHGPVAYSEVSYEQLTGPFSDTYRKLMVTFIGAEKGLHFMFHGSRMQKLHPGSCQRKIENWKEVARALDGTHTLKACNAERSSMRIGSDNFSLDRP